VSENRNRTFAAPRQVGKTGSKQTFAAQSGHLASLDIINLKFPKADIHSGRNNLRA